MSVKTLNIMICKEEKYKVYTSHGQKQRNIYIYIYIFFKAKCKGEMWNHRVDIDLFMCSPDQC